MCRGQDDEPNMDEHMGGEVLDENEDEAVGYEYDDEDIDDSNGRATSRGAVSDGHGGSGGQDVSGSADDGNGDDGDSSGWETVDDDDDDGNGDGDGDDEVTDAMSLSFEGRRAGKGAHGTDGTLDAAADVVAQAVTEAEAASTPDAIVTAASRVEAVTLADSGSAVPATPGTTPLVMEDDGEPDDEEDGDDDADERSLRAARAARAADASREAALSPHESALLAAYAEHEQFWVDESEGAWTWHQYYAPPSTSADGASADSSSPAAAAPVRPPQFTRIAQKQWKQLKAGLPDGIYVVASADRADLLRALITGPPGTPYHDAVFIFDLQLPPEFPMQPPSVHYISHGERINPNLYENGKVCLSLLGTWTGRQSCELWNPETSSVLQVLISIQGLVLCEMPYFNEAGYEKQLGSAEGAYHARRYNEGALLLSLKSMINSIRYLAPPFNRLIRLHFAVRRRRVLGRLAHLLTLKSEAPQPPLPLPPPPPLQPSAGPAALGSANASNLANHGSSYSATDASGEGVSASSGVGSTAEGAEGDTSNAKGAVALAELSGVLNQTPSLGFLHSLDRQLDALMATLESIPAAKLVDEITQDL